MECSNLLKPSLPNLGVLGCLCPARPSPPSEGSGEAPTPIARTIKSFEKALHSIFTHPSYLPHPAHQFSHLAQSTLQNGHTQNLIRPEREAQRGPFASQYQDGKAPFRELGGPLGGWESKKGKRPRTSLATAKIQHKRPECKSATKRIYKKHLSPTFLKSPTNNRPPLTYPAPHSMAICTSVHQNTVNIQDRSAIS